MQRTKMRRSPQSFNIMHDNEGVLEGSQLARPSSPQMLQLQRLSAKRMVKEYKRWNMGSAWGYARKVIKRPYAHVAPCRPLNGLHTQHVYFSAALPIATSKAP